MPTVDRSDYCPGCMTRPLTGEVCSWCGYDSGAERHALALPLGERLNDRFYIGRVLGKPGGYGITYLAFDTVLESPVAIKEYLPPQVAGRSSGDTTVSAHTQDDDEVFNQGLDEFVREARTLVRFAHPNIARVRDFFTANGTAYLIMDYYRGESLNEYLVRQRAALTPRAALDILMPVLDGLETIHEHGFLHRDIKPSNIYLTESGTPILLDFGAARQALAEGTQSLSVIVSRSFAPYEQHIRRSHQGPWTDIYAFAATLYYMLTATRPPDALERKADDQLLEPTTRNSAISPGLNHVLLHALAVEPEERVQSVPELKMLLTAAMSGAPPAAAAGGVAARPPAAAVATRPARYPGERIKTRSVADVPVQGRGRQQPWLFIAAILAVVAAVLAASQLGLFGRTPQAPPTTVERPAPPAAVPVLPEPAPSVPAIPSAPERPIPQTLPEMTSTTQPAVGPVDAVEAVSDIAAAPRAIATPGAGTVQVAPVPPSDPVSVPLSGTSDQAPPAMSGTMTGTGPGSAPVPSGAPDFGRPPDAQQPRYPPPGATGDGISSSNQAGARGPRPPQIAVDACTGKSAGASCSFQAPHGRLDGMCYQAPGGMACVPLGAPPPRSAHGGRPPR